MHQQSRTVPPPPPPVEDKVPVPPIMRIPREVRGIIFNKLPQLEMVCLRYVCKAWREEVDDFCEFSVLLDDRRNDNNNTTDDDDNPRRLDRLMDLRIRKCKVLHLLERLPTSTSSSSFFKCPSLLKSLKIATEKVSPENFCALLNATSCHIKEFCGVLTRPILQFSEYPTEFSTRFDNLRRLRLSVSTMSDDEPVMGPPQFQDKLFYKIFGCSMKNLKMLAVEIRCLGSLQCSRLSSQVLSFIANHHKILEHVDFDLIQGHGVPLSFNEVRPLNESDMARIDFAKLKKCQSLQSIRVVNSTAVGVDIWQNVLANQKHLQFLETDILPAPNQLYKQIILNNEQTLVHVDIGDLTINLEEEDDIMRRFDCAVFQNCHHLRKLTLDRNTLGRRPQEWDLCAELINLHLLPEYLEELNINYFLILSDELLILFGGNGGAKENMKSLALTQCGDSGDFGVDGSVLEKVIAMKSINFIEVSPLNFTYPEERQKLNQILATFGYTEGHGYFQLSRVSQNTQ